MVEEIIIAGIGGSLRNGSYNGFLLKACQKAMPQGSRLEILNIANLPLYNQDEENKPSAEVAEFKSGIRKAHGVLFVTPEYNYSVPGFLKNAIDIASRPVSENPFMEKPAGIMSASMGQFGGMRAQYHLRQILVYLDMAPIQKPEIFVSGAHAVFDAEGNITDADLAKRIAQYMAKLVDRSRKLKA